ncbi:MAG: YitT family protein [Candidatus Cryptobacteroides sp.]
MTSKILQTSAWTVLKEYALITVGIMCYTLGWTLFLIPNNLVGGGVSGISAIVYYATGIKMGYTYFVLNVVLFLIALKILGGGFGGKTVWAIVLASFLLNIWPDIIPSSLIKDIAIDNGKLICTLLGAVMSGVGIGLSISQGGSTGGTDIVALIWCKFHNASPGRVILIIDIVIILASLCFPSYTDVERTQLVPFYEKIAIAVYGLVLVSVSGYAVDLYLSGTKQSVQAFIFTKKYQEVADAIAFDMKRGVTLIPSKGWFTKEDSNIVMVIIRKTDLNLLLRYVKQIDNEAFLSVGSVMGVYGKGFDTIKLKTPPAKK